MSKNKKPVIEKVYLESVNLEASIIIIPENEIGSKLSQLNSEKGLISRSAYEEFLLEHCAANLFQLSKKIEQHPKLYAKVHEFRQELIEKILQLNPLFNPENVYVDRSGNLSNDAESDEAIQLDENQVWDREDSGNFESAMTDPPKRFENPFKDFETEPKSEWWERLKMYIIIKQYSKEDCAKILSSRLFYDRQAFEAFIVTVCVQTFEELFKIIDAYGLSQRVPPPMLMHELYELCQKVNPTLLYENTQSNGPDIEDECEYDEEDDMYSGGTRYAHASSGKGKKNKKKKKLFKDISIKELSDLDERIKQHIIGQDEAVEVLVEAIQRAKVGLRDPDQPIGSFIFAGSTGIGKTETTKILNTMLIKEREGLIKIDCSEYQSDHEYAKLIGSPAGYIGHDEGGVLTNAIRNAPFSIVVFDEVEKASSKVHDLMLQIMDEGRLTDGKGQTAYFSDAIVIMTSNVGVKHIKAVEDTIGFGDVAVLTDEKRQKAFYEALKKKFKPEFLNRIDEIVYFMPLKKKDYLKIVDLELNKVLNQLKRNSKITVMYDTKVRTKIYKEGIDEKYGARPLKRCIKKNFANPLAKNILKGEIIEGDYIQATVENKKLVFNVVKREKGIQEPPFYLSKRSSA